jgi:LysM repeat protein
MKTKKTTYKWSFHKFFINMMILAIVIITGIFCISLGASATQNHKIETITVQSGDTLWSIAANIAPDHDPRQIIAQLQYLNHLDGSVLESGQNLKVEIYD